jgi:hypothetical protein
MDEGLAIEEFIQALTTQLDRTQAAMALKARNMNLPLTFAVKDITLDLRSHIDVIGSQIRIRPADPGEREASIIRLALTTITRPMIEENATEYRIAPGDVSIKEALSDELTEDEQRRLEWAGVHTISQLERLERAGAEEALHKVSHLPVGRLRAALTKASRPMIKQVMREDLTSRIREQQELLSDSEDRGRPPERLIRVRGRNLYRNRAPRVEIGGRPVQVIASGADELLVDPGQEVLAGVLSVETEPGYVAEFSLDADELSASSEVLERVEV